MFVYEREGRDMVPTTGCVLPSIDQLPLGGSDAALFNNMQSIVPFTPQYAPPEPQPEKAKHAGKGQWTVDEDKLLLDAMATFQGHICWEELSKKIPGRTAKQCRERWQFRLHPDVSKMPFQPWEDDFIINERLTNGNHWARIASMLPGRTSCAVKNRWYTVLRNRKSASQPRKPKCYTNYTTPFMAEALMLKNRTELWKHSP